MGQQGREPKSMPKMQDKTGLLYSKEGCSMYDLNKAKIAVRDSLTGELKLIAEYDSDLKEEPKTPGSLDSLEKLADTLGTHNDHLANFERAMHEMRAYRESNRRAKKRYQTNLSDAKTLVDSLPLVHLTSYEHFDDAKTGLKAGRLLPFDNKRMWFYEREIGLDNFVFASFANTMVGYTGIPIYLDQSLLEKEGTLFSIEDPAVAVLRVASSPAFELQENAIEKGIQNYLKMLMPGSKFKEFMSEFIATHYADPYRYLTDSGRPDRVHNIDNDRFWKTPEILIYGGVDATKILNNYQANFKFPHRKEFAILRHMKLALLQIGLSLSCSDMIPSHKD